MTCSQAVTLSRNFPQSGDVRQMETPCVHSTNGPLSYSATLVSVPSRSTATPPAFAMALLNSLAVRCSGLSRRSRAILWRSSPYFLMRCSRYDLSPKDVCRSRTVAEAARFSRSTGPLVSYRSILPSEKTTSRVRDVNLSATL